MLKTRDHELVAFRTKRQDQAATRHLLMNRALAFFKDFDHFIDFCLARFNVWREVRRERRDRERISLKER
jgi:hypothetical protein